ncbi:hypothetical protein [Brevibacterium moorei]|uniref:hypothetical protein n=1 Tax=Brevibacterium moorei TaxID=2968457 RepID=UPI00211CA9DC|nr:hypothetical protein [Brevibacterium sp. 68QC2CO]MCQ9384386.1 hypothetical protein [Brevibacterium sp. 68QC2CO]
MGHDLRQQAAGSVTDARVPQELVGDHRELRFSRQAVPNNTHLGITSRCSAAMLAADADMIDISNHSFQLVLV